MENTAPNKGIKFVVRIFCTLSVDKEMKIEVSSNCVHVVIDIFDLLRLPQNIYIFHFLICHFAVGINKILSELKSKLVL